MMAVNAKWSKHFMYNISFLHCMFSRCKTIKAPAGTVLVSSTGLQLLAVRSTIQAAEKVRRGVCWDRWVLGLIQQERRWL